MKNNYYLGGEEEEEEEEEEETGKSKQEKIGKLAVVYVLYVPMCIFLCY